MSTYEDYPAEEPPFNELSFGLLMLGVLLFPLLVVAGVGFCLWKGIEAVFTSAEQMQ